MATDGAHDQDDTIPYLDEVGVSLSDSDEEGPLSPEDLAHAVGRLQAGQARGEYAGLRESDLAVLSRLTVEEWQMVKREPSLLPRILARFSHA